MNLVNKNPNFSIIVPASCNAKCSFCFWDKNVNFMDKSLYLAKLRYILSLLPSEFTQVSITGGEPTRCTYLTEILDICEKRFDKLVLSTNSFEITSNVVYIDHVNISRHHYNDRLNGKIFGDTFQTTFKLHSDIRLCQLHGKDVTLNCVIPEHFTDQHFIVDYIKYAKSVNANAVAFRKMHGNLDYCGVEHKFTSTRFNESSCPVCKTYSQYIDGMKVTWKYSVSEPSNDLRGVYELIFQADGRLTSDWAGNHGILLAKDHIARLQKAPIVQAPPFIGDCHIVNNSTCGSFGCGQLEPSPCGIIRSALGPRVCGGGGC